MSDATTRRRWTAEIFLYVALLGVLLQMRGALLPSFETAFHVSASELGLVSTVASVGYLPASFASAAFVSRLDVKRALLSGLAGMVLGLAWIVAAPTFPWFLAGMLVVGVSSGFLQGLSRPVISHLYAANRGRVFNRQDMVWAIGATLGPGVATLAVLAGDWRFAYAGLGIAFLPLALVLWGIDAPESIRNETHLSASDLRPLLGNVATLVLALAVLLLSFVESGVFTWLPYYLDGFYPRSTSNLVLSGFLAAYVPGRYVFGLAADRFANVTVVLVSALLALPLLVVAFVLSAGGLQIAAILGLGFLVAGMFPTLLAWGTNRMPEYSGPVSAVVLATSGVGFMIYPAVMGVVADYYDPATAMRTLVFVMAGMVLLMAVVRTSDRRSV